MTTGRSGNNEPKTIRSFIAIELPETIRAGLQEVQQQLQTFNLNLRWVRPQGIHLTLKFLGDIPSGDVEAVGDGIQQTVAGCGPISLCAKGIGVFPGMRRPRVLWVGLAGQVDALMRLQASLEENLASIGYPKENRPFRGHLTLARVKGRVNSDRLRAAMAEVDAFESEMFTADRLILYKSVLKPSGAVYTELMSAGLIADGEDT
jgi:2'-5' RNA ligase